MLKVNIIVRKAIAIVHIPSATFHLSLRSEKPEGSTSTSKGWGMGPKVPDMMSDDVKIEKTAASFLIACTLLVSF
jgi:hypothetical protein